MERSTFIELFLLLWQEQLDLNSRLKNPLIQSLLNKARTTRSTDNLTGSGVPTDTRVDSSEEEQEQAELP